MRCTLLVSLLMILILTTSTKSDSITTGNLITNGNFETGNANGWTTSGDVQVLNDFGMKVAAVAILCQDERVFESMIQAGTPCPIDGKIGKEAEALWSLSLIHI